MAEKTIYLCEEAFESLFPLCDMQRLFKEIHRQHKNTYLFLVSGGFKVTAQSLSSHKKRLKVKLPSLGSEALIFPEVASTCPGPWQRLFPLLQQLKDDALQIFQPYLLAACGPTTLVLALFQFPEDSPQRHTALELLKDARIWQPDEEASQTALHELAEICPLLQANTPPTPQQTGPTTEELKEMLRREYSRGRSEQEQNGAKDKKKVSVELKETQRQLREAQDTIRQLHQQLQAQANQAEQHLKEETDRIRQQLTDSHESFLKNTLLIDHQLQQEAVATQITTDRLLAQIAEATAAQRDLNQNHGSKNALRQQQKQLQEALRTLQLAAEDSFVTVKDLKTIMAQTNAQILLIQQKLDDPEITSVAYSQLVAHISAIPLDENGERRLHDADDFIMDALNHELLQDQEATHLQGIIQHRLNTLKNLRLRPLEKNLQAMTQNVKKRGPAEIWYLSQSWTVLKRVTLIFDGYNAMKRSQIWSDMEQQNCLEVARKHFVKSIKSKLNCFQRIEIVFDGTGTTVSHEDLCDTMRITFSAHINDEHNADDVIVKRAKELRQAGKADLIWVVTNDYDIRNQLQDTCNAFVETSAIPRFFLY